MIKRLKNFFRNVKRSVVDFEYYKEIAKAPLGFSLKYLFFLTLLTAFVTSLFIAFAITSIIPKIPDFSQKLKTAGESFYPKELVISVKSRKIVTNVKEPYYVEVPENLGIKTTEHLVAIDTKASASDYKKYNSVFLVTEDSIVAPDSQSSTKSPGSYKVYPLTDSLAKEPDGVVVNRRVYDEILGKLLPYLNYLPTLAWIGVVLAIFILPFIISSFTFSGKLFYLLFFTLILWLVAKIMKKDLGYGKLYRLSIHGSTIVILLDLVLSVFGIGMPFLLPSLILLVFMILVLSKFSSVR